MGGRERDIAVSLSKLLKWHMELLKCVDIFPEKTVFESDAIDTAEEKHAFY